MNQQCFQVGEFFLDPANRLLRHGNVSVSLSPKAFDALVYLARNPGRLLTRDELIQALWPDSYVEEGNLSVHIFQVRKALGVAPDGRAYIQTVPKQGYRFNAVVKVIDPAANGLVREASDALQLSDRPVPNPAQADNPVCSNEVAPQISGPTEEAPPRTATLAPGRSERTSARMSPRTWKLLAGGVAGVIAVLVIGIRFIPNRQAMRMPASPMRLTSFSPELSVFGLSYLSGRPDACLRQSSRHLSGRNRN